ncbi:PBP1A family penicillin-binding protein [soil metagenome]
MDLPFSKNFRRRHPGFSRGLGVTIAFGAAFGVGFAYSSWALVCRAGACPSVDVLDEYQPRQTSKLFAADGRFIAELGLERRTLLKIDQIPPLLRNAFIETEDKRFYTHSGVDFMRVPGALLADIRKRSFAEGFSTITMQLARNIFPERLSREKSLVRKLKEAKVARAIEARYSKDKILELYLNQIALGNGSYGVETASQRYFGKSARDLNLAEAAMLAGLPKAPERYNPRRFPERAIQRRNTVIEVMRSGGGISDADASLASAYPLQLARKSEAGDVAPYFVEFVRQQLEGQFGQKLYEQGLKVFTTLDVDLQSAAERALENQLKRIESGSYGTYAHPSFESYLSRASERVGEAAAANSPYLQGAFIAMDPRTGSIRALVGGRDFDDSKFNRATQALRQPGSTFKPIVYADAVQNGRPPSYIVDDSPVDVPQGNGQNWTPQNYDAKFEGPMPMRRGLYQSRNIIAIKVGMELGTQSVIDMARKFGITTPIPPYPSIYIGAADVYPLEMIAAYSAFATLGTRASPIAIVRVENSKGDVLWEPSATRAPVMSPEEAWIMVSMMKDVIRRGTAASVGAQFPYPSGGKTGTTNDGADVWFIGYTSDLVAGVWMGLDKPAKIKGNAQGGQLAAPAWTAFMKEVYRRKPAPPDWPRPDGIVIRDIDPATGLLAGPGCSGVVQEFFIAGTDPMQACAPAVYTPPLDSLGTRIDTSFGFPPIGSPPPRRAPSGGLYPDTTRPRIPDSTVFTRPTRVNPGSATTAGYTPVPARPFARDTNRSRRDSSRARPDTTNPFRIPPQ